MGGSVKRAAERTRAARADARMRGCAQRSAARTVRPSGNVKVSAPASAPEGAPLPCAPASPPPAPNAERLGATRAQTSLSSAAPPIAGESASTPRA